MGKKKVDILLQETLETPKLAHITFTMDKTIEKNNFSFISLKLGDEGHGFNFYEKYCFDVLTDEDGNTIGKKVYSSDEVLASLDVIINKRYPILKLDIKELKPKIADILAKL